MRRPLDFYETPPEYIAPLLEEVRIFGRVYEPCVGEGAISGALDALASVKGVATNDIDPARQAMFHCDARELHAWPTFVTFDWCVTNPPFSDELAILQHALEQVANVAFLARLSFLEPTEDRAYLLESRPPTRLIVLPRYSFRLNDDGKRQTDSVTCAWLVWSDTVEPGISAWGRNKSAAAAIMRSL